MSGTMASDAPPLGNPPSDDAKDDFPDDDLYSEGEAKAQDPITPGKDDDDEYGRTFDSPAATGDDAGEEQEQKRTASSPNLRASNKDAATWNEVTRSPSTHSVIQDLPEPSQNVSTAQEPSISNLSQAPQVTADVPSCEAAATSEPQPRYPSNNWVDSGNGFDRSSIMNRPTPSLPGATGVQALLDSHRSPIELTPSTNGRPLTPSSRATAFPGAASLPPAPTGPSKPHMQLPLPVSTNQSHDMQNMARTSTDLVSPHTFAASSNFQQPSTYPQAPAPAFPPGAHHGVSGDLENGIDVSFAEYQQREREYYSEGNKFPTGCRVFVGMSNSLHLHNSLC